MSAATISPTSSPNEMSNLPGPRLHGVTTGTHGLPREYEVLLRLARALASCAPGEAATEVAELLRPFASFEYLDIVAVEDESAEVLWHSTAGAPLPPGDVPIEQTKMWWVYQHQQPLCIADWSRDDRFALRREALKTLGCAYESLCCIPLRTSRQCLGVLRMASLRPNNFSEDQVRFLHSVADQLAVAISERLSRKRLRMAESQLEVSTARFELIMSVVHRVISAEQVGEVLIEVTGNTRRILDCDVALVALFDNAKGGFKTGRIEAVNPGLIANEVRSRLTARLDRIVLNAQAGKPWTGRVEALDEIGTPAGAEHAEVTEACVIPILARGQCLGSMALARGRGQRFTPDEVAFVSDVAAQLAIAIELANANSELQELRQDFGQEKVHFGDSISSEMNFEGVVGKSACLGRVLREVEIVAPTDSGVLILGETGTGKELIARAVHDQSSRRHQNFIKVNCAAIPSGLLESELFGHEKGAFTGAVMRKAGRFEVADKGTIFLDEVGDIPLDMQPKLLRILQEHEFERLGSTRTQQVDVRVIAATHRDLKQMVEDGQFRSDLYYRLNIFPLTIPPLRDRAEDIPILVRYYVENYARRLGRRIEEIPSAAMEALNKYCWPGNVRELQNFIERAVILSRGQVLHVPLSDLEQLQKSKLCTLEDLEKEHVLQALREAHWVIGGPNGAAARLGMKRTTLAYRIRKLKIPRKPS